MKAKKWLALLLALILCAGILPAATAEDAVEDTYPIRFDLREYGVVTPVKIQNPWGTCWSFGGIAAAETSILSSMGRTAEEYKAQTGKDFDLSEKHLAWYAVRPITALTNPGQAGEGLYAVGGVDNQKAVYNTGGYGVLITSLFSCSVGPVPEDAFPYRGAEGLTDAQFKAKYPDRYEAYAIDTIESIALGMKLDQLLALRESDPEKFNTYVDKLHGVGYLDESISAEALTLEDLKRMSVAVLDKSIAAGPTIYSANDDWTIPDVGETVPSNRDVYIGLTLVDGNVLPAMSIKDSQGNWVGINDAGMRAVKSELLQGRGVSIAFQADQSKPGQAENPNGYLNMETWAHYTYTDAGVNHAVCIVGWDDTYPKENFKEGHQPPADGAWIVKNSWGSETDYTTLEDGTPYGKNAWGVVDEQGRHTGYFYLSYYDKSMRNAESMVFDSDLYHLGGQLHVLAYDYMPSYLAGNNLELKVKEKDVIKTANVFTNVSGKDLRLYGVSTKTASSRARVQYSIYRLNEGAVLPEDGELLDTIWAFHEYAGFHRESLDGDITVKPNDRIAIVVTEYVFDKSGERLYEYDANQAWSKEFSQVKSVPVYGVSVVNKGESFIYIGGTWIDWSEYELPETDRMKQIRTMLGITGDMIVTDNFSIKAYLIADV